MKEAIGEVIFPLHPERGRITSYNVCYTKLLRLVQEYPIKSQAVVSHIRQANRGGVCLENTHPFTRELWGRYWTFAHNGQLTGFETLDTGRFEPVGSTDSERAFCWLLAQMATKYPKRPADPLAAFADSYNFV